MGNVVSLDEYRKRKVISRIKKVAVEHYLNSMPHPNGILAYPANELFKLVCSFYPHTPFHAYYSGCLTMVEEGSFEVIEYVQGVPMFKLSDKLVDTTIH